MSEPRKASDILLSLETKIDQLVKLNAVLDLNNKIISNKLNEVVAMLNKNGMAISPSVEMPNVSNTYNVPNEFNDTPKPTISTGEDFKLPMQSGPQQSYGRTSRSETFENAPSMPAPASVERIPQIKVPQIIQKGDALPIMAPPTIAPTPTPPVKVQTKTAKLPDKIDTNSKIAIGQRIVNSQGKAVFLANIDIVESNTKEVIAKARTNSLGKWSAVVPIGQYDIIVRKMNVDTKELIEVTQHTLVDGTENPFTLDIAIIK